MSTDLPPDSGGGTSTREGESSFGVRRPRRGRLSVLAVAAAVLLAGGGGAYWASTAGDGDPDPASADADRDLPTLALDGFTGTTERIAAAPGTAEAGDRDGQGDTPIAAEPRVVYRAAGALPEDGPDSARVYHGSGPPERSAVARLAAALKVPGTPRLRHGSWEVGTTADGQGPVLRVSSDTMGHWSYLRYGQQPEQPSPPDTGPGSGPPRPPAAAAPEPGPGAGTSGSTDSNTDEDVPPVSEERAKRAAAPVLKALGLVDSPIDAGATRGAVRVVAVQPELDGLRTDRWQTELMVGADGGLVQGNGRLARPEQGEEYPVLSAERTLKELNGHGVPGPRTAVACRTAPTAPPELPDSAEQQPNAKASGDGKEAVPAPKPDEPERDDADDADHASVCGSTRGARTARVTGAEFGLAAYHSRGEQLLVPSWLFEVADTPSTAPHRTVSYPAVEPRYLGPADQRSPSAAGGTGDSGRGGDAPPPPGRDLPTEAPATPGTAGPRIDSYSTHGRTLTLRFAAGACSTYRGTAEETADAVTVRVLEKPSNSGKACILVAKPGRVQVTLDEPVGDRTIVDHAGRKLPRSPDDRQPAG